MGMYDYNKDIEKQYDFMPNTYKSMGDHYYKYILPKNFANLITHKEYIEKMK